MYLNYTKLESDVLPINGFREIIMDHRIIEALQENNLLLHGLKCSVKSLLKSSDNNSILTATISIKNLDNINYYIPDPTKTGSKRFHYLGSFLEIMNVENKNQYWPISDYNFNMDEVTMKDLSILESNSEIYFSYSIKFNSHISKGLYHAYLHYGNIPYMNNLSLSQFGGRIWIGTIRSKNEYLEVY